MDRNTLEKTAEHNLMGKNASSELMLPATPFSCKVILNSEELPRLSKQWTRAKRCTLTFEKEGLSYLDLFTLYSEIDEATIQIYQSALFFEYGILSISTPNGKHHFGIKYSDEWKDTLPFPVERVKENTPFLLFRKSLILCIVVYIFWEVLRR
jgi:hypothetical protein